MSVKVFACLNPLSAERGEFTAEPGTIAGIINSLDSGFPLSQARACLNGEIIKDFSLRANDGDALWVKFVPCGTPQQAGGAMKKGGWWLAFVGVLTCFIPGAGLAIGAALIGAGLSLALGGAVLMNLDVPKLGDHEKPDSDPSIRGGRNQARPYGRVPVLFGRHRVYPDLAANPYTSIINGKQYLTMLFCGGYKDCVIDVTDADNFKLGETPLVKFSKTKDIAQILSDADPFVSVEILQNGEASNLYPFCVHEDAINAALQNEIDDGEGGKAPGEITRDTPCNTDSINVDIFFPNGIGKYNDEGKVQTAAVTIEAHYKQAGEPDGNYQPLGFFNGQTNQISGNKLETRRFQITKNNLPRNKYSVRIRRVTPDSASGKIVDQAYVGSIRSIKSADEFGRPARPVRPERQKDLTVIAMRVMASDRLKGVIESFNYVATAKMPVYSGNGSGAPYWLSSAETRNPASALLYALRGRAAQQRVDPDDIDWPSLEAFYEWCEEHEYYCDAYLSESVTIAELLRMIGGCARAEILRIDSKISVVQDVERPSPVQLFTPKNTVSYSVTMLNADVPDAISVRFVDEEAGYAQNELLVHNTPDGNPAGDGEPDTIQKLDLWGVANSAQARRIAMYNYGCIKNRPFVHVIEVDVEYLLCNKGDLIQYAGDIALTGAAQGRIKGTVWADGVCVGVDTDEPMPMAEGKQYAVRIRRSDGTVVLKEAVYNPGRRRENSIVYYPGEGGRLYDPFIGDMYAVDEEGNAYYEPLNLILFVEPMGGQDAPKAGDIYAFGERGYEAVDLIITGVQPGQNLSAVLTCVEHSPEIFGVDDPGFVLPEFENKITPVSGAVDSGVVNSDRWRSFYVYHDDDEEPRRPSGDGRGGGWHSMQTYRSVWQSMKTAESAESGEWGSPVRIKAERGSDDVTPVWLSLSPRNITLETDGDGNILAGLLPLAAQARLLKWNSHIEQGVSYSLENAPAGISINQNGLITIADGAALSGADNVAVKAEYEGSPYADVLSIAVKTNSFAPRYLGTIAALPAAALVVIVKGPAMGEVRASQGDFVFAPVPLGGHPAGGVFQWTGLSWEYRSAADHTDLYLRCYTDGLDAPGLADNVEWFGAAIIGQLIAQRAFIEALQAQVITLSQGGIVQSENFVPQSEATDQNPANGFRIKADGDAEFNNGVFNGIYVGGNSKFSGQIDSGVLKVLPSASVPFHFTAGGNLLAFREYVKSMLGYPPDTQYFTIYPTSGTFNFRSGVDYFLRDIRKIEWDSYGGLNPTIASVDGRTMLLSGIGTPQDLDFTAGTSGLTLRLPGLPPSTAVQNEVYKYNGILGVTLLAIKD